MESIFLVDWDDEKINKNIQFLCNPDIDFFINLNSI